MNTLHAIDDYVDQLLTPPAAPAPAPAPAPAAVPVAAPAATPAPAQAQTQAPVPPGAPWRLPRSPDPEPGTSAAPEARKALARWLRLRCGAQTYALELLKIREVVLPAPLLPLRGAAPAVSGVMNLRGQVVPVIDLGLHFDGVAVEQTPATRVVVLEERNEVLGLQVTAVDDIVLIDEARVESARASRLAPVGDERIRGIARLGGQLVMLLDAGHLLATPLH